MAGERARGGISLIIIAFAVIFDERRKRFIRE